MCACCIFGLNTPWHSWALSPLGTSGNLATQEPGVEHWLLCASNWQPLPSWDTGFREQKSKLPFSPHTCMPKYLVTPILSSLSLSQAWLMISTWYDNLIHQIQENFFVIEFYNFILKAITQYSQNITTMYCKKIEIFPSLKVYTEKLNAFLLPEQKVSLTVSSRKADGISFIM